MACLPTLDQGNASFGKKLVPAQASQLGNTSAFGYPHHSRNFEMKLKSGEDHGSSFQRLAE
jgi:hypothetical protein